MGVSVSVIVPVYNIEAYLRRCLDSLVMQTLEAFEIIVVNDASPDRRFEIMINIIRIKS
ncbi:glycosyltransferase [Paenibacillus thiaminolyticus]|uniref:Glycosyltransferase n=1 Tax=Paenibacillus thiaminolyticus TaxID=49283 RepID=A0A3A3GLM8_PANTH|nr:glycosyltransferase [Paenibacillus thiaminolyticus]